MTNLTFYKNKLIDNIIKYGNTIWNPNNLYPGTNTNYNIFSLTSKTNLQQEIIFTYNDYEHIGQTCKIVNIFFDKVQKSIIKTWFSIYRKFYNFTIKIFSYLQHHSKSFITLSFYDIRNILSSFITFDISKNYKFNTFYVHNKKIIRNFYNYRNNEICNNEIKILKKSYIKFNFDKNTDFIEYSKLKKILYKFKNNLESCDPKYFNFYSIIKFYYQLEDKYKNILKDNDINFNVIENEIYLIESIKYDYFNIYGDELTNCVKNNDMINYNVIFNKFMKYEKFLSHKNKKILSDHIKNISKIIKLFDKTIIQKLINVLNIKIKNNLFSQITNHLTKLKNYKNKNYRNEKNIILQKYNFIKPNNYKETIRNMQISCVSKKIKIKDNILYYENIIGSDHLNIYEPQYKEINRNKTNVSKHTIEHSIHKAFSNYSSCVTNLKQKNIKNFDLKKMKLRKNIVDIEPREFIGSSYRETKLGKVVAFCDNILFDLGEIKQTSILKHESGKYTLYVPYMKTKLSEDDKIKERDKLNMKLEKVKKLNEKRKNRRYKRKRKKKQKKRNNKNKKREKVSNIKKEIKKLSKTKKTINSQVSISLDPGIRKFVAGYSHEKKVNIEIKPNKKIIQNCDKIYKHGIKFEKIKKRKKEIDRISNKISRQVTDCHNKIIHYLTENYNIIMIGDMNIKSILNKETSKLRKYTKNILSRLRIGLFRKKLEMKCNEKKLKYMLINEAYTSKTCSNCSSIKEDLGSNEVYKCEKCNLEIDRDLNGAKNIYLASF